MARHGYYTFCAEEQLHVVWDTIAMNFAASSDLEWEVVPFDETTMLKGQPCVPTPTPVSTMHDQLHKALVRNDLVDKMRIRTSRKRGGHCWLQKIGAENHPEQLASEKIAPMWTNRRKKKKRTDA